MQTILVCDDDKEIVEAIDIYLQQEGYQVLKAYDGEEALEILKEKEVHLLIIDVMMPRLEPFCRRGSRKHFAPPFSRS